MNPRILVVDDDPALAEMIGIVLRADEFDPHFCGDGAAALEAFHEASPDLVLLDLMLPGLDGLQVCENLRRFSAVPIVMITARVEEVDRLLGLGGGADDYICKPFSPREMVARVKAILRRSPQLLSNAAQRLVIDPARYQASLDGIALDLTPLELRLLSTFAGAPGRVFSRDQLLDKIYSDHRVVTDRTVDSHIRNLRRKLEQACPGEQPIESLYGVGYRFQLAER